MATVNYTLRIDEADKRNAEQVFKGLGMSFATGITIYLKTVGRQQRIPFSMDLNQQAAPATLTEAVKALREEAKANRLENMTLEEINAEINASRPNIL